MLRKYAVQMASPKALLQQLCHKGKPVLPAPRLQKISRSGEPPRYACTIVFPQAKVSKSKKAQAADSAAAPSGSRTWQVLLSVTHRCAIAPQYIEQFRIVLYIFQASAPTIQRDCPSMM